jgi:hypothetical protein
MERFYLERHAIMGRMRKKKPKKQSDRALLSEVKKEMAQPRAAVSTGEMMLKKAALRPARDRPRKKP